MIFKEFFITPDVFCYDNDDKNADKLITLLDLIEKQHFILSLNYDGWAMEVAKIINEKDGVWKNKLETIFKNLIKKKMLFRKKSTFTPNNENEWIKLASEIDEQDKLIDKNGINFIVAKYIDKLNNKPKCHTINQLDLAECFERPKEFYTKEKQALERIFYRVLGYSKKALVIDPYFHIDDYEKQDKAKSNAKDKVKSNAKWRETLKIMVKYIGINIELNEPPQIIIHCHFKEKDLKAEAQMKKRKNEMERILKEEICKDNRVKVEIRIWCPTSNYKDSHDRFILTKEINILSSAGFDSGKKDSMFTLISDEEKIDRLRNDYSENYPNRNLRKTEYCIRSY